MKPTVINSVTKQPLLAIALHPMPKAKEFNHKGWKKLSEVRRP
ncbi:MAG: hypothetical protein V7L05_12870 [Nostoc sp.]